jgi:hypothetical protein
MCKDLQSPSFALFRINQCEEYVGLDSVIKKRKVMALRGAFARDKQKSGLFVYLPAIIACLIDNN